MKYFFAEITEKLMDYEFSSAFLIKTKGDTGKVFARIEKKFGQDRDVFQKPMNTREITKEEYKVMSEYLPTLN